MRSAKVCASPGRAAISGAFEVAALHVHRQEQRPSVLPSRGDLTRAAGAREAWLGSKGDKGWDGSGQGQRACVAVVGIRKNQDADYGINWKLNYAR